MPKIKTRKSISKRFRIKRSKKGTTILKRTDGQDHFNARESGKVKRNKKSDNSLAKPMHKTILRSMPHN